MKRRFSVLAVVVAATFVLGGCAASSGGGGGGTPVIAPVTESADALQGATVDLKVGQVLNINTGSLAPESYSAEIADTSIASFSPGGEKDGATFNPGITALKVGETDVVLSNSDGGIQDVSFTVAVSE